MSNRTLNTIHNIASSSTDGFPTICYVNRSFFVVFLIKEILGGDVLMSLKVGVLKVYRNVQVFPSRLKLGQHTKAFGMFCICPDDQLEGCHDNGEEAVDREVILCKEFFREGTKLYVRPPKQ